MTENIPQSGDSIPAPAFQNLRHLRHKLLYLHKVLLDDERAAYERVHGQVSSGELLQLVINDEQFAWLRVISELVVRIDEMLDADEPVTQSQVRDIISQTRTLLTPSETGNTFEKKYYRALQRGPAAVLAHREVKQLLILEV